MATKYYCDGCGRNVVQLPLFKVNCHFFSKKGGYTDQEGEEVSDRMVEVGLCSKCYNETMRAAVNTLRILPMWKDPE